MVKATTRKKKPRPRVIIKVLKKPLLQPRMIVNLCKQRYKAFEDGTSSLLDNQNIERFRAGGSTTPINWEKFRRTTSSVQGLGAEVGQS